MGSLKGDSGHANGENLTEALLPTRDAQQQHQTDDEEQRFGDKLWLETRKLWLIVGPSIFSRLASFTMNVVTQAFAGHLGDVELAAISIANNVLVGFNFGLLLGMASALETLCGQAFGAKRYHLLGIYMQSQMTWQSGAGWWQCGSFPCTSVSRFSFLCRDSYSASSRQQLLLGFLCWVWWLMWSQAGSSFMSGILDFMAQLFLWTFLAFSGLWEFLTLSSASGVMLCLENWYYKILLLMTGQLENATIAVDALSVCMTINGWEMMIPLAFFAGTGVRVANELGAGNGKAAKFATQVSVAQSTIIGLIFCVLIMIFHEHIAYIFTTSTSVLQAVDNMSLLLAITILLNSVQPVLSGVAVGSGWQAYVAYINIGCYYLIGFPLGIIMGWVFKSGVIGIWGGMIFGGTAIQTLILIIVTIRCDWEKEEEKACFRVRLWRRIR